MKKNKIDKAAQKMLDDVGIDNLFSEEYEDLILRRAAIAGLLTNENLDIRSSLLAIKYITENVR